MRAQSVPASCPPPPPVQVSAGAGRRGNHHISRRRSFGSQEVHFNLEVATDLLSTAHSLPSIAALLFLDRRRQKLHLEGRNLNYVRDWVFALREGALKERYELETNNKQFTFIRSVLCCRLTCWSCPRSLRRWRRRVTRSCSPPPRTCCSSSWTPSPRRGSSCCTDTGYRAVYFWRDLFVHPL